MSRTNKLFKNLIWELGYYAAVVLLGFLAPRYIIMVYGSEVNGLSSAINQILNVILLLQAGATTASVYSLFKPIANSDMETVASSLAATEAFFRRISLAFAILMVLSAFATALCLESQIEKNNILIAFLIMGTKSFLDLLFTSKFRVVFTAFQQKFILSIATLVEQIIYYVLVFITLAFHLHFLFMYIWLLLGCIIKIVILKISYQRKYSSIIPKHRGKPSGKIPGRTYSLANEVSHSVVTSSITIIISFMYGLQEVSIYSVYALVSSALSLVSTALLSSFTPSFGDLVASGNQKGSTRVFTIFQFIYIILNAFMMMCMVYLLVPFVSLYTGDVAEVSYNNVVLAILLAVYGMISAVRVPYNCIVSSCGYFKETWTQPVVTALFSLVISIVAGLIRYELILLGPIVFYSVNYVYQHIRLGHLCPHLISNRSFVIVGFALLNVAIAALLAIIAPLPPGLMSFVIGIVLAMTASMLFLLVGSWLFVKKELLMTVDYFKGFFKKV